MADEPKWRRRKEARPGDIVRAALAVFSEKGFASAKMDEIASRAGVSKGAVYLYFPTKEELFAAVVKDTIAPQLANLTTLAANHHGPAAPLLRLLVTRVGELAGGSPVGRVAKMVIGESGNFPELARIWHDAVIANGLGAISTVIEKAQAAGEFRKGDPRLFAVSIISPLLIAVIFRETFVPIGARPFDIAQLAEQHIDTMLAGLLAKDKPA